MIRISELSQLSKRDRQKILGRNSLMQDGSFDKDVSVIIQSVRRNGDRAVQQYNKKWSGAVSEPLFYTIEDFKSALDRVDAEALTALQYAAKEIRLFHSKQINKGYRLRRKGRELGVKYVPHERVAVYAPGGKALYPSSILMGVIPAVLAGVRQITVLTPANESGRVSDMSLAACALARATGLYAAGGAQAIAAAGCGTETLPKVSQIVGPGNNFVNRAKWQLFLEDRIAIDSLAGPSEVLIIAESGVEPEWVAADLLSQAEHGQDSAAILLTTDKEFAEAVSSAVTDRLAENTSRNPLKREAIKKFGHILLVNTLDEAIDFSNEYAPEHLQIMTKRDDYVLNRITNAGSVFIGAYSPVAAGDYCSGTNHILPTSGLAGIYSGLSVDTFYRRFTYQKISEKGLIRLSPTIEKLARIEGLDEEHGRSVRIRLAE